MIQSRKQGSLLTPPLPSCSILLQVTSTPPMKQVLRMSSTPDFVTATQGTDPWITWPDSQKGLHAQFPQVCNKKEAIINGYRRIPLCPWLYSRPSAESQEKKSHLPVSPLTLNVNGLNSLIKRHTVAPWLIKQDPVMCSLQETHFSFKDMKVKG